MCFGDRCSIKLMYSKWLRILAEDVNSPLFNNNEKDITTSDLSRETNTLLPSSSQQNQLFCVIQNMLAQNVIYVAPLSIDERRIISKGYSQILLTTLDFSLKLLPLSFFLPLSSIFSSSKVLSSARILLVLVNNSLYDEHSFECSPPRNLSFTALTESLRETVTFVSLNDKLIIRNVTNGTDLKDFKLWSSKSLIVLKPNRFLPKINLLRVNINEWLSICRQDIDNT